MRKVHTNLVYKSLSKLLSQQNSINLKETQISIFPDNATFYGPRLIFIFFLFFDKQDGTILLFILSMNQRATPKHKAFPIDIYVYTPYTRLLNYYIRPNYQIAIKSSGELSSQHNIKKHKSWNRTDNTVSSLVPFLTNSNSSVSSARLKISGGTNLEKVWGKQFNKWIKHGKKLSKKNSRSYDQPTCSQILYRQ